ncbi:MAG TPA: hypothetical protein VEP89_12640, partial [Draconibacterium sp.]|nr:hypothetical protein [Draconibacterium sp.]
MKQLNKILLLVILIVSTATMSSFAGDWVNFNNGWKFTKGNPANANAVNFDDSAWESVKVPHD